MTAPEGPEKAEDHPATGILVFNKPSGVTSRKMVDYVARLISCSRVGHAGTLDPLASGVLLICVGRATRLVENLQSLPKSYRTVIRLGGRSDTLDGDGRIEFEPSPRVPSLSEIEEAFLPLLGEQIQRPPAYSALKIKGQRAYDLARAGQALELGPRSVRIDRIAALHYEWPLLELEIDCGGGTYIRSIARDIGETLGCGGFVEALVRTRIGPFALEQAIDPQALSSGSIRLHLRPALDAVPALPRLVLDASQLEAVAHGRRLSIRDLGELPIAAGRVALLDNQGTLVALGELDPEHGRLQPRKVLI